MRKSIYSFVFLWVIMLCQISFPNQLLAQSRIFTTYYLTDKKVDAGVLKRDSLNLFKVQSIKNCARLELYNDSKFCLFYNVRIDTISNVDKATGCYSTKIVENADKLTGKFGLVESAKSDGDVKYMSATFILKDDDVVAFDVSDQKDRLVLKKK